MFNKQVAAAAKPITTSFQKKSKSYTKKSYTKLVIQHHQETTKDHQKIKPVKINQIKKKQNTTYIFGKSQPTTTAKYQTPKPNSNNNNYKVSHTTLHDQLTYTLTVSSRSYKQT